MDTVEEFNYLDDGEDYRDYRDDGDGDDGEDDNVKEYPVEDAFDTTAERASNEWEDAKYCDARKNSAMLEPWYVPYTLAETHTNTDSDNHKPKWLKDD